MKKLFIVLAIVIGCASYGEEEGGRWSIGPSIGTLAGALAFGGDINAMFKIQPRVPLYIGGQSGLYVFTATGVTGISIPLLASMYYRFVIPESHMKPFLGVSMGMNILTGGGGFGGFGSFGFSGAAFELLFRMGIELPLGKGRNILAIEPKFGIISSGFVFLPHVGFTFPI